MTALNKFFEMFRNLKSDAMPRPPRPRNEEAKKKETLDEENDENIDSSNEPEEILIESDDETQNENKPKFKKSFFKPNKKKGKSGKKNKDCSSTINTQATGNVINVVNSTNVRWGNDYYMGPTNLAQQQKQFSTMYDNVGDTESDDDEDVKKSNSIKLVLEAKIKPEHEYLDHISKNLGKTWQNFFIKLGFSKNRIETIVIDTNKYGVSEARYKLLVEWINSEEDPSLGRLATLLWKFGEKKVVKELAALYEGNKN